MGEEKATLKISPEMRDWLKSRGRKGETYDDVLRKLREIVGDRARRDEGG